VSEKLWRKYKVDGCIGIAESNRKYKYIWPKNFCIFFRIFEGTTPLILLSDPELLRNVLIKDSHVFSNRRVIPNIFFLLYIRDSLSQLLEGVLGPLEHGLTALKDEAWKNARSIVSPTFSSAKLKSVNVYTSNYSL
jgi:cytochrome P450